MSMTFDEAVEQLAEEDGAGFIITQIPGVWECVSEYYNNDALKLMEEEDED